MIPMIPLDNPQAHSCFKELISKRIDLDTFIEDEALELCISQSGGCIRQLLILVNRALVKGSGAKITLDRANEAVAELSERLREALSTEHFNILKSSDFKTGDSQVREMLYRLVLLKYNGPESIKLNPVLEGIV